MMVCFGMAWPFSVVRSWRARTSRGKSWHFLAIVFTGYVAGLLHKLYWQERVDGVVWLYLFNALMVAIDGGLYLRNAWIDRQTTG